MTRQRILHGCALLLTAFVFLMSSASVHHNPRAQEVGTPTDRSIETVDVNGNRIRCADLVEAKAGVILGYIIPCITHTIEGTTERMSAAMIDWLMPTVWAFITLVVVLFGVRVLQGGGQVHTEGILLLLKIGIVIAVLQLIPHTFVPMLYKVMDQTQEIVAGTITPDTSSIRCDVGKYNNTEGPLVWAQMDCLIGKLWGVTTGRPGPDGAAQPNMLLAASIFGMMGGFLFGGSFGVVLFITCAGVLWTMMVLILRTVVAFLNGYLYACLMLIIAPLFLPLTLLKVSASYFDPWWKGILASIILPILITSYTMFAMLLYDRMLFDDGSVSKQPSLLHKLFNSELVKEMQGMPQPMCDMLRPGDPSQRAASSGQTEDAIYRNNPFFRNFVNPLLTASNNQCLGLTKPTVDTTEALGVGKEEAFRVMFLDCVKLLVLAIMIGMGTTNISNLARRLSGSTAVASSLDARGGIEQKFSAMQRNVKGQVIRGLNVHDEQNRDTGVTSRGTEFIGRLRSLPGSISEGIVGGISKD